MASNKKSWEKSEDGLFSKALLSAYSPEQVARLKNSSLNYKKPNIQPALDQIEAIRQEIAVEKKRREKNTGKKPKIRPIKASVQKKKELKTAKQRV